MNLSTLKNKKSLKIVGLLIASLIIATVSAQVYSYMYINGSATITGSELVWVAGENAPAGTTINGHTVNGLNFSVPQNTFKNFTDALRLTNNKATSISFDLSSAITAGDIADFTTFDLVVYNTAGDRLAI
jgi:hypothetical protein